MDLHEDSKNNKVTATFELPGLKKEDVSININDNRLTVSGESSINNEYDENGYAVRERRYGNFSRTLQLPQDIKVSLTICFDVGQGSNVMSVMHRRTKSRPRWTTVSSP